MKLYLDENATSSKKIFNHSTELNLKWQEICNNPDNYNSKSGFDTLLFYNIFKENLRIYFNINQDFEYILHTGATEGLHLMQLHAINNNYYDTSYHHLTSHNSSINAYKHNMLSNMVTRQLRTHVDYKRIKCNYPYQSSILDKLPDIKNIENNIINSIISIDLSQAINYDFNINTVIAPLKLKRNKISLTFGLHKKLGMLPGAGITILINIDPSEIQKSYLGGDNSNIPFNKNTYTKESYYNSGTFNFIPFIYLNSIISENIDQLKNYAYKSDPKKIGILKDLFEKVCNIPADIATTIYSDDGKLLVIYPAKIETLSDINLKIYTFFEKYYPYEAPVYRIGRFCCDNFFEHMNLPGAIRFSI